jgi:hypothetical protein
MRRPVKKYGRAAGTRRRGSPGAARAIHAEKFDEIAVGGDQALRGVHHQRKEADEERDDDDAGEPGADPEDEIGAMTMIGVICRIMR